MGKVFRRRIGLVGANVLKSLNVCRVPLLLVVFIISCRNDHNQEVPSQFLIQDVTLIDGTGNDRKTVDVRIVGSQVDAIGDLSPNDDEIIDGTGLVLSPGFIDTHSHHDRGLFENPEALVLLSQGVTTIIVGQDGGSRLPIRSLKEEFLATPTSVNLGSFVGHGTIRSEIMGVDYLKAAEPDEIVAMGELLSEELESGALGLSTGLEYDPGIYSTTSEVEALARITAEHGKRYSSHMRSEDRNLFDAIEETISIARATGIPVHISHIKLAMKSLWGRSSEILLLLDQAREEGLTVTADLYPYEYWQSTMTVLFPDRDFNREAAKFALEELAPPEGILIDRYEPNRSYEGQTLAEISEVRKSDPVTTYLDLIAESQAAKEVGGGGGESIIGTSMATQDIATLLKWPYTNVASDGSSTSRHPRGYGSFPKIFRTYVRERGDLSLEEAIHKMTGLASETLGLQKRGTLEAGSIADMVLFDPERIADMATRQDPHAHSIGVVGVWVSGSRVYENGLFTGVYPGRWIGK